MADAAWRARLAERLGAVARCPRPAVSALANALSSRYEAAFREVGITNAQFTLLSAIGFVGEAPATALTQYVARDQTTLSRGIERLRARGWVRVVQPEEDRRVHLVSLTDEGVGVLDAAMDAWERVRAELDAVLGHATIERLIDESWAAKRALDAADE